MGWLKKWLQNCILIIIFTHVIVVNIEFNAIDYRFTYIDRFTAII